MKQLLILSGKGGTGKTTTAAAFIEFSKTRIFADCDVDAPNLHLVMEFQDTQLTERPYLGSQKSSIDLKLCTDCGACEKNCRFDAIHIINGHYRVNPLACEGCGVCLAVCKSNAITLNDDVAGNLMLYQGDRTLSTAKLKMGRGNSGKLVSEVKNQMRQVSDDTALVIIDGSPGIGCPVIASISGVDMVLLIAEPSISGISDMKRIWETCAAFHTKAAICVNKYDICLENTKKIELFCKENNIPFVGKIPYDEHVNIAMNSGKSIAATNCLARAALSDIYTQTMKLIQK